jgi:hypothetical protein
MTERYILASKVESCATCDVSRKFSNLYKQKTAWECVVLDCKPIPCARGKLPRVPKWCPRRKA